MSIRPVKSIVQSKPTLEGAGVKLNRAFGFGDTTAFDPFLLLDDFRNDRPDDYLAGFPWHPHRGIETITYVLAGTVEHGDSLGNRGLLSDGDVQWMTAGSGIMHQEMPQGDAQGRMHGFQLWANLPSSLKMTAPRYQDVPGGELPEFIDDDGTRVRIVCGEFRGKKSPVDGIAADPRYLDISVPPGKCKTFKVEHDRHAFAYVFAGSGTFRESSQPFGVLTEKADDSARDPEKWAPVFGQDHAQTKLVRETTGNRSLVLFDSGDEISVQAGDEGIRFLLVSGRPIEEPVAWYGPIVMNTQAELNQAVSDLRNGTFIKHG
jgi:quercetin 2,3-dioxygenase